MAQLLKQSSTAQPLVFLMVQSSDHITGLTGASPTVTLSKNGGSFASPAGSVTEIANGWYKVAGNATDTATLGPLILHATAASGDPTDVVFEVVAFDPQDSVRAGLTALPNAAAEAAGGLYTRGTGAGQINQNANGQVDVNPVSWKGGTIPTPNVTGEPLVDPNHWKGGAIPTPNVTGEPLVDVNHWRGSQPNSLITGLVPASATLTNVPGFKKNTATSIQFVMADNLNRPVTGLVDADFTKAYSQDGGAFGALSGTITEVANGLYNIPVSMVEMNGDLITFYFAGGSAVQRLFAIKTNV